MQPLESSEVQTSLEISWGQLRSDLIARLRQLLTVAGEDTGEDVSDEDLLIDAQLATREPESGETRLTLAALLLLGSDDAIRTLLPHHGTLAVRKVSKGREGAREDIRTNLFETHDRLVAFAARHLPIDLEGSSEDPTNLRDLIFGEVFANALIFRDYSKTYPARFVIEPNRVVLEYGQSLEKMDNLLAPLAGVLLPLLGQNVGISATLKWGKTYFGLPPLVFEGSVFRFIAPFPKQNLTQTRLIDTPLDFPEMLAEHAPWNISTAAQSEIAQTGGAIEAMNEVPIPSDIIRYGFVEDSMQPNVSGEEPMAMQLFDVEKSPTKPTLTETRPADNVQAKTQAMQDASVNTSMQGDRPLKAVSLEEAPLESMQAKSIENLSWPTTEKPATLHGKSAKNVQLPGFSDLKPSARTSKVRSETVETSIPKNHATVQAERTARILQFCKMPRYRSELQDHVGINNRDYFRKDILNPLIESGLLLPTLPDKPNSPKQQYRTVSS